MQQSLFNLTPISKQEAHLLNAQVLAFVGDSVHTLYIRTKLSKNSTTKSKDLHKSTIEFVRASGQSEVIEKLVNIFNEDELTIYKRARNYKTHSQAKNASVAEYKRATGFEAVLGYLYLTGQTERLNQILEFSV